LDVNRHLGNSFNRNSYSLYYSPFSSIIIKTMNFEPPFATVIPQLQKITVGVKHLGITYR
jgi:hypothetical protein